LTVVPVSEFAARRLWWSFVLAFGLLLPALPAAQAGQPEDATAAAKDAEAGPAVGAQADELLKQIAAARLEDIWEPVSTLVRAGRSHGLAITGRLTQGLLADDQKLRLACADALCQLNDTEAGAPALCKLLQDGATPEIRRLAANALGLTKSLADDEAVAKALAAALAKESDGLAKVSLARSLALLGPQQEGREALRKLLAQAPEQNVRDEAALALAENGAARTPEVLLRLKDLNSEPTAQGDRARALLRSEGTAGAAPDPKVARGEQLLREICQKIKDAYPDEEKGDADKLFEDAAKGMVAGLDPFSQYLDREAARQTQEMLQQDYGGIGAYVEEQNGHFIIRSPMYDSPADRAGLRAGDIIQEVDGQKASDLLGKGGMNSVIAKLKGKPGTPVKVKYYRRGFFKPVEVTIVRGSIRIESVLSALLPGELGYVRLLRFGERSREEMQKALDQLLKTQHAKALILDLRDNPGGLLRSAVDIADLFLAGNKLVVYSEGRKSFAPRKEFYSSGGPEKESYPLAVLVGPGSASASEIVAGAMQDLHRAVLIGEKTFGKGSVQQLIPMNATGRQTNLRLTIAKYYLPSGRCIHEKGVEPDVQAKRPEIQGWVVEGLQELRDKAVFAGYLSTAWDANKELCAKLALDDEGKCENWPGFENFYKGLNTRLDRNDVRAAVRTEARRRLQDEQKKELVYDLETDVVLERGVLEILKKLNSDPLLIAEYKALPDKFKKKDEMGPPEPNAP